MTATRLPLPLALLVAVVPALAPADPRPPLRLVIVGGGERPPEALARFVEWGGGSGARLLVVPWASAEPKESCAALLEELRPHAPGAAGCGPPAPLDAQGKAGRLDAESKALFRAQLAAATGVFFTGGDQSRIMDVLADEELLRAVLLLNLARSLQHADQLWRARLLLDGENGREAVCEKRTVVTVGAEFLGFCGELGLIPLSQTHRAS